MKDCELKPCSLPLTVVGGQPLRYVGRSTLGVVDNLRPYNGQDSSNETATADDELPEEHVTRDDVPEESTLPTPDVSWEELPDTDALGSDADIPKRCRRRPRYLDDYVQFNPWLSYSNFVICFVIFFFCSSFTVYSLILGY